MNGALLQHAAQEHAESAGAVLVVDDEKSVRTAIARLLRSMGVRVYTAGCTDEALATLEAHADDVAVIVSDYAMPGADGGELLRSVRNRWPGISRVMLTGKADLHAASRAVNESRLFRLFAKPWHPRELQEMVAEALEFHRTLDLQGRTESTGQLPAPELAADLGRGLANHELVLHYQPIVLLATGQVVGVEALVRWNHPRRGLVAPLEFIPVAEESGLIEPLGLWVLREACRQASTWQDQAAPLGMAVNVSLHQLHNPRFAEHVARILLESGLNPANLTLEITESVLAQDAVSTAATLDALKGLGLQLAIDDFGTGYSSLSYLGRFPIDVLKIDKSFVDGMANGAWGATMMKAIVSLGLSLGLRLIAEGVETADQVAELRGMGCELAQGYYFSRPKPASELALADRSAVAH
jgi:EAL domain-containing protein (putative c-di-GMP-specific phosphodiesterase class I)/CheY-like chemotaxis protein